MHNLFDSFLLGLAAPVLWIDRLVQKVVNEVAFYYMREHNMKKQSIFSNVLIAHVACYFIGDVLSLKDLDKNFSNILFKILGLGLTFLIIFGAEHIRRMPFQNAELLMMHIAERIGKLMKVFNVVFLYNRLSEITDNNFPFPTLLYILGILVNFFSIYLLSVPPNPPPKVRREVLVPAMST